MKKIVILACVLALPCLADWAFVSGTNVLFTIDKLPSTGRIQATQQVVFGLPSADEALQRSCGYWTMMDNCQTPAGMRVATSQWVVRDNIVERVYTYEVIPPRNYTISKYKLLTAINQAGLFDAFTGWLDALPKKEKMLWDAATSLDSTNALVTAAIATLPTVFNVPASAVTNILERSEADAK